MMALFRKTPLKPSAITWHVRNLQGNSILLYTLLRGWRKQCSIDFHEPLQDYVAVVGRTLAILRLILLKMAQH